MKKLYAKEDLRKAFEEGKYKVWYSDHSTSHNDREPLDFEDFIKTLYPIKDEEEKLSFTYSFLKRKLGWEKFCDLTGTSEWAINEGGEINDNEIYYFTISQAKKYNLL
jgi:hypothetical protein